MLLEILDHPILVDGKPVVKTFRLNLPGDNRLRLKADVVTETGEVQPVDIVVYGVSSPSLDSMSTVKSTINGEELTRGLRVKLAVSFNFFKYRWKLKGKVGSKHINEEISSIGGLLEILKQFV